MPVPSTRRSGQRTRLSGGRSRGASLPPPIYGWNARDPVSKMDERDAVRLDNWFPRTNDVVVRNGFDSHATGLGDVVESLMTWNGPSSSKMFGAAGANIYDVTSGGAVGAAAVSSLTSARWQHVNFGNSSGAYLYIVNGADAPRYYDGSSWTTPTITGSGLTASNLVNVTHYRHRLIFCEKNKLGFWYFPVDTISGAITYYDLAPLCKLGGFLMAVGTWTRDGGDGVDDFMVCLTSEGEVIVFQGTNPGDSQSWFLVGVFRIGQPIGRRCLVNAGADLIVISKDGFAPLSRILPSGRIGRNSQVSDKIQGAVLDAVVNYSGNFGWQPIVYPQGNMIIFNVPVVEGSVSHQYVSNGTTGAWCRFTGQDAACFELYDDDLYFGGNGVVYQADSGLDDNGNDIETDAQTAFSYLGARGILKQFTMARPILETNLSVNVALETLVDFEDKVPTAIPSLGTIQTTPWDTSAWDTSTWADTTLLVKNWQTTKGIGYAVSLRMQTKNNGGDMRWLSNDILWEPGGYV